MNRSILCVSLILVSSLGCQRRDDISTQVIFVTKDPAAFGLENQKRGTHFFVSDKSADFGLVSQALNADISASSNSDLNVSLPVRHVVAFIKDGKLTSQFTIVGDTLILLQGKRYVAQKTSMTIIELVASNSLRNVESNEISVEIKDQLPFVR